MVMKIEILFYFKFLNKRESSQDSYEMLWYKHFSKIY